MIYYELHDAAHDEHGRAPGSASPTLHGGTGPRLGDGSWAVEGESPTHGGAGGGGGESGPPSLGALARRRHSIMPTEMLPRTSSMDNSTRGAALGAGGGGSGQVDEVVIKAGFLGKRGNRMGVWKTKYFVLTEVVRIGDIKDNEDHANAEENVGNGKGKGTGKGNGKGTNNGNGNGNGNGNDNGSLTAVDRVQRTILGSGNKRDEEPTKDAPITPSSSRGRAGTLSRWWGGGGEDADDNDDGDENTADEHDAGDGGGGGDGDGGKEAEGGEGGEAAVVKSEFYLSYGQEGARRHKRRMRLHWDDHVEDRGTVENPCHFVLVHPGMEAGKTGALLNAGENYSSNINMLALRSTVYSKMLYYSFYVEL